MINSLPKSLIEAARVILEKDDSSYKKYVDFKNKILVIGYGSVGQAIVPLLLRHLSITESNITILEKDDHEDLFMKRHGKSNIKYIPNKEITKENYTKELSKHVSSGDLIVNCSLNIDAESLLKWCMDNDVMQIDTSLERWKHEQDEDIPDLAERTLYATHKELRSKLIGYKENASTCLVTSGANPGYVSSLTKRALLKLADHKKIKVDIPKTKEEWSQLSKSLGVKVIQISEYDSQVINKPREPNEFQCTWSPEGFIAESRAPSEYGFGTHDVVPSKGKLQKDKNAGFINAPGAAVYVKSWSPRAKEFNGFLIQHSEAITISQFLTTDDNSYRPTVYYAYRCPDCAISSMHDVRGNELEFHQKLTIVKEEIVSGMDELGVFLIGDDFALWHGSQLDISKARNLVSGESATSLQVAGHMLACIVWMINNPKQGYTEPEALPFEEILEIADQYWEPLVTEMTDWKPTDNINKLFPREINKESLLCLDNFIVWD